MKIISYGLLLLIIAGCGSNTTKTVPVSTVTTTTQDNPEHVKEISDLKNKLQTTKSELDQHTKNYKYTESDYLALKINNQKADNETVEKYRKLMQEKTELEQRKDELELSLNEKINEQRRINLENKEKLQNQASELSELQEKNQKLSQNKADLKETNKKLQKSQTELQALRNKLQLTKDLNKPGSNIFSNASALRAELSDDDLAQEDLEKIAASFAKHDNKNETISFFKSLDAAQKAKIKDKLIISLENNGIDNGHALAMLDGKSDLNTDKDSSLSDLLIKLKDNDYKQSFYKEIKYSNTTNLYDLKTKIIDEIEQHSGIITPQEHELFMQLYNDNNKNIPPKDIRIVGFFRDLIEKSQNEQSKLLLINMFNAALKVEVKNMNKFGINDLILTAYNSPFANKDLRTAIQTWIKDNNYTGNNENIIKAIKEGDELLLNNM